MRTSNFKTHEKDSSHVKTSIWKFFVIRCCLYHSCELSSQPWMFYHSSCCNPSLLWDNPVSYVFNTNFTQFLFLFSIVKSFLSSHWSLRVLYIWGSGCSLDKHFAGGRYHYHCPFLQPWQEKFIDNSKAKLNLLILLFQIAVEAVSLDLKCLNYKKTFLNFNLIVNIYLSTVNSDLQLLHFL